MSDIHKAVKVADSKKAVVKRIADLIKKYPIIGSLNMESLPAAQLQRMKGQLRDKVEMLMTKRRLMKLAIEQAKTEKKGIEKIEEHLKGMPALLFTKENPFTLFKILKKSKSKAPAKGGQIAPADIIVKAGPTSFAPGPVIGELGALGIKSKVEEGKIAIIEDSVVCKEGEEISAALAGMLTRLGIEPMQIGLDLVAVYEKGDIFTKSVLDIDEDKFMADLSQAATWAFNLSVDTAFVTDANKEMLIQKAFMDSKALALSQNIMADAVVADVLAKAEREMLSLKSAMPELPAAEAPKAEEKKEEAPKVEEKPDEAPKEEPKVEEKAPEPVKEEPQKEEKTEKPTEPISEKAEEKAPEPKKEEPKAEAPKEIPEKLEEPKAEVAKVEKKAPEVPKEEPKAEEKPAEEPKKEEEAKPDVDKKLESEIPKSRNEVSRKVKNIVEQAKIKAEGKNIAEKLVEDVEKEADDKRAKENEEMKKVEELAQTLVKKGTLENAPSEEEKKEEKKKEKKEEEKSDVEEVEDLTKQLMKKGTLRK